MRKKSKSLSVLIGGCLLIGAYLQGCSPSKLSVNSTVAKSDTTRSIAPFFVKATSKVKTPDNDGFIQRWMLLEPINKPNRGNTVFTDSYLRENFTKEYFPNQFATMPKDGEKVKAGEQELTWHALESTNFNVKLYRFAYGLRKQVYGVLFWGVTVIDSPREMKNVRLAVGSNSASMWWLNGKEAALLSGDRRMVMDDVVSNRLTLNKGRNVLRVAIINGPGMSDFCVRFLDENGHPIKDLSITCE
ncbi:MAG TPA: hypothetical protein VK175_00275 [Leadbetterella sp.]|nr:hypothetical protein [Leadbetterella sp.]